MYEIILVAIVVLPIYVFGIHIEVCHRLLGGYPDPWGLFFDRCFHWWKETGDTRTCTRCKARQVRVFSIDTWMWIPYDIAKIMGVDVDEV